MKNEVFRELEKLYNLKGLIISNINRLESKYMTDGLTPEELAQLDILEKIRKESAK